MKGNRSKAKPVKQNLDIRDTAAGMHFIVLFLQTMHHASYALFRITDVHSALAARTQSHDKDGGGKALGLKLCG